VHLAGEQRRLAEPGDRSSRWPAGWRNNRSQPEWVELALDDSTYTVVVTLAASPPVVEVDGCHVDVQTHRSVASTNEALAVTSELDATIDGVRRRYCVAMRADTIAVDSPLGSSTFRLVDRLPVPQQEGQAGSQVAPMPGTVVKVLVEVGQTVEAGDPLVVLEAMKMEHTLTSPHAGIVEAVHVNVGDQVERGERLVSIEPHS
jgi:propionyl-CoA carboxylase alpha chain